MIKNHFNLRDCKRFLIIRRRDYSKVLYSKNKKIVEKCPIQDKKLPLKFNNENFERAS